jgi:hypothetical protein
MIEHSKKEVPRKSISQGGQRVSGWALGPPRVFGRSNPMVTKIDRMTEPSRRKMSKIWIEMFDSASLLVFNNTITKALRLTITYRFPPGLRI